MKKLISILLLLFLLSISFVGIANAQEAEPNWPVYIVQPGDTLYAIAIRFGLTLDEIILANGMNDPNSLAVGSRLILPGLDWVSGELTRSSMPLGENLRSLSRRHEVDAEVIARLSGFVSPKQLAAGYPLMIPKNEGKNWELSRVAVAPQTSLLEIAILTNNNPWSIQAVNRLEGKWDLVPGDILLMPGTDDPGPGALPSPISQISFDGISLVQGKTAVFRVSTTGLPINLDGEFLDHELNFFEQTATNYVSIQGVHAMTDPGKYPLWIAGISDDGTEFNFNQKVLVSSGGYYFEELSVDQSFLDQQTSDEETNFINTLVSEFSEVQYWEGVFFSPSPYFGQYNSLFGTRRSFNGSGYIYYHGGLDYQGGAGVKVYAPTGGQVVFAGPLTIRGNAIVIDHGRGVFSGYSHQSEIRVEVGDIVSSGQVIGLVGNTGRSTGAHLHWEIWVGGVQVDPIEWLTIDFP